MGANLHADTGILVTVSSDKRIRFRNGFHANMKRELEGSIHGMPASIDLAPDETFDFFPCKKQNLITHLCSCFFPILIP
jgi:hypothetical protein